MIPRVAFVIPVYKGEAHIRHCVDSLLAQEGIDAEIVAVDDGSPDNSAAVLASYGDRVKVLKQENRGVSVARNAGFGATTAPLVTFIDQDDWLDPRYCRTMTAALDSAPDALAAFCAARVMVERNGELTEGPILPYSSAEADLLPWLLRYCFVSPGTVMMRREAFEQAGGFDEDLANVGEDLDLWFKLAYAGKYAPVRDALFYWREHEMGNSRKVIPLYRGTRKVLDRHVRGPRVSEAEQRECFRHHREFFAAMLRHALKAQFRSGAKAAAIKRMFVDLASAPELAPYFVRVPLRRR